MKNLRARALSYWRASRRLLLDDTRTGLTTAHADVVLFSHAIDIDWPRLSIAATDALVLARRRQRAAETATSVGRSRSRGRRRRRRAD